MGEVVEAVKLTNKDDIPEELARFDGLGLDANNRLVGMNEEGKTTRLQNVGALVMEIVKTTGIAEEMTMDELSPDIMEMVDRTLEERMKPLTDQMETVIEQNRQLLDANQKLQQDIKERDERIEELLRKLKEAKGEDLTLNEQLEEDYGDQWIARKDEDVILIQPDGYTDEGWKTEDDPFKKEDDGWYIKIKKGDDVQEVSVESLIRVRKPDLSENDTPPPDQNDQSWRERLRSNFTRRRTTITEYDDQGRPINSHEERSGGGLAVAIGLGAFVLGALAIEIYEHKIMGHSTTREFRQIAQNHLAEMKAINAHEHVDKIRDTANHAAEMKAINNIDLHDKARHAVEMKAIAADHAAEMKRMADEHKEEMNALHILHNEHAHAHAHDLDAINGVLKAVNKDHHTLLEHAGAYRTHTGGSDFSGYATPWDYTHNESQLHTWASRAAANGHKIRWIPTWNGKEMLEVDGTKNTQRVLQVITQYK